MAFPDNTTLLDDTTRANADPINTSGTGYGWSAPVQASQAEKIRLFNNQAVRSTSAASNSHGYITTSFAADQEFHFTLTAVPTGAHFLVFGVRIQNPNNTPGLLNAYYGGYSNSGSWFLGRIIGDDTPTTLTSSSATVLVNGDKVGVKVAGSVVSVYSYHSATWTQELTWTMTGPDIYNGAGYLWVEIDGAATEIQLTDFRGGATAAEVGTTLTGFGKRFCGYGVGY